MRASLGIAISLIVAAAGVFAFSHRDTAPLAETRIPVEKMNLTSISRTSAGLLAAGEQGHILISGDEGNSWQVAQLSHQRSALITQLTFSDENTGLAIGHEGWILRTTDGGLSWQEVAFSPDVSEPLMSIARLPSGIWMAVGAFGKVLISEDDGLNWNPMPAPGGTDWHLNSIIPSMDRKVWMIVGEAGTLFRSEDGGESWQQIPEFYNGSLYGGLHLGQQDWLVYGMRGNIFRSSDNGSSWKQTGIGLPISMFTHEQLDNGQLLLGGQGGIILSSQDKGLSFEMLLSGSGRMSLTDIQQLPSGKFIISSDQGLQQKDSDQIILPARAATGAS